MAKKALEYLCDYKRCMLSVGCANAHLKLVEVIDGIGESGQSQFVHKTSKEYLTRQWFGKGTIHILRNHFLRVGSNLSQDVQKSPKMSRNFIKVENILKGKICSHHLHLH